MKISLIYIAATLIAGSIHAQTSGLLQQYRSKVEEYNQDIRSAVLSSQISNEKQKSAKADFLPSLSGNANFNYVGNPSELSVEIPSLTELLYFQGRDMKYGASLTLAQPVYMGGAIKAGYDKAKKENEMSQYEIKRITNNIIYNADVYYWNKVARQEMTLVAKDFKESIELLVDVVKDRVNEGYTDRNDLLMAEVKLNDAEYRLVQSLNDAEVARMSMNSFSGIPFDEEVPTDSIVIPLKEEPSYAGIIDMAMTSRPEMLIASGNIDLQRSSARLANSQYMPKLSVGIDGSYSSPGYNFKADLNPNYAIYAKLSVPIFEWGKRRNTRKAGKYAIDMATENQRKVTDNVRLEVETAFYNYSQAVRKVSLTESSLNKAEESKKLAFEKYREGNISIVEVINAEIYHLEAKVNFIQTKLNAQIARSGLERARGERF